MFHSQGHSNLKAVIRECPAIDNHCHNLLVQPSESKHPFENITSEADGVALKHHSSAASHLRAKGELKSLYGFSGTDVDWTWETLLEHRRAWLEGRPDELVRRCLKDVCCMLMDDGLSDPAEVNHFRWHDKFTDEPTRRILRIETLAEGLLEEVILPSTAASSSPDVEIWHRFKTAFQTRLISAMEDQEIVAFKSIICYRGGLDINPSLEKCLQQAKENFNHFLEIYRTTGKPRITRHSGLNDYLVLELLETMKQRNCMMPVQFHTGVGDSDINLLRSNAANLQAIIEAYPNITFVLLHSGYPYTREAAYLAMQYGNVYLDIGLVFPILSPDGQMSTLRHAMELAPATKLLWSSDGHYFPETYWLANRQFRYALHEVLVENIQRNTISEQDAIRVVTSILFENSNRIYSLNLTKALNTINTLSENLQYSNGTSDNAQQSWWQFDREKPPRFICVQWLDLMGTLRCRFLPAREFQRLISLESRLGISEGNTGTLQNDHITSAVNTTGQIYIEPDITTLRPAVSQEHIPHMATVVSSWTTESGQRHPKCPRGVLRSLIKQIESKYHIHILVGFEIEVTFLKQQAGQKETDHAGGTTDSTHSWCSMTAEQWNKDLGLLAVIVDQLEAMDILVQQFHAESGRGQYEFILPPYSAVRSVDTLYQARQAIKQIAHKHGMHATLHPQPMAGIQSGAHSHISINPVIPTPADLGDLDTRFWEGVLDHLEAICAFSMPEESSYSRLGPDKWTGGVWIGWGTHNREVPIRKSGEKRHEVRCLDGFANMYLALAAIVAAGIEGVDGESRRKYKDCPYNPDRLSREERAAFGIDRRMPATIEEALAALASDKILQKAIGADLVADYLAMKQTELEMLHQMPDHSRQQWLLERY